MTQYLCDHMLERRIEHEPSSRKVDRSDYLHSPGDRIVLVCPYGCDDIIIDVVETPPTDWREEFNNMTWEEETHG